MDVFGLRNRIVSDCVAFTRSFTRIRPHDIRDQVDSIYGSDRDWPEALLHLVRVLVAWSAVATTAVLAAPSAVPFADERGFMYRQITYNEVVRTLGQPEVSTIKPEYWDSPPRLPGSARTTTSERILYGGELVFGYPSKGLEFMVMRVDRQQTDPPIRVMKLAPPATARTPQGLALGMPYQAALDVARARYKVITEYPHPDFGKLELADDRGYGWLALTIYFRRGVLQELEYDFKPPKPSWLVWTLAAALVAFTAAASALVARLLARVKFTAERPAALMGALDVLGVLVGLGMAVGGVVLLAMAVQALSSSSEFARFGGLVLLGAAAGVLMLAVFILGLAWRSMRR